MDRIPSDLWDAYERTRFCADVDGVRVELRIGEACPALTLLLEAGGHGSWCFITAWNPGVARPGRAENERQNAALRADLTDAGWAVFEGEGVGEDPSWEPEASFLALGASEPLAVELARWYGQYAIVFGEAGEPPRLIDCRPASSADST